MFGMVSRCARLERTNLHLKKDLDVALAQRDAKAFEADDAKKGFEALVKSYRALLAESQVEAPVTVMEALEGILDDLGNAKWVEPEEADAILRRLIHDHYLSAHAVLAAAGRA